VKVTRDYIIGAFIGGAAVSLLNIPRVSSLKEDSKERQAQYVNKAQELDRQLRQAENKDQIIELQRQQMELDKTEISQLRSANASLSSFITQLENRPPPPPPKFNGLNIQEYFYIVHVWREHSAFLSNQVNNLLERLNINETAKDATAYHNLMISLPDSSLNTLAQAVNVNSNVFNTFNRYFGTSYTESQF